ncbi:MAG TPA: hypothetical protein VJV79_39905 [Polyangiaceae bacterium]|nr:hypothetical protein [Polyangiaceae bacterium]
MSRLTPAFKGLLIPAIALAPWVLTLACGGESKSGPQLDGNRDRLADGLGSFVDANGDGVVDMIDINNDKKVDGLGVDTNSDGKADALALDLDCDGVYESLDVSGDGVADRQTGAIKLMPPASCQPANPVTSGAGGAPSSAGAPGAAGSVSRGGSTGVAGSPANAGSGAVGGGNPNSQLGNASYQGSGDTTAQYAEGDVYRNDVGYMFIANGWGKGWKSHSIAWQGTSFTVKSLEGMQGTDYSPAGYPTMFCGLYSMKQSDKCGLPIALTSAKSIKTGWRWKANGNNGQYNAAWDIWLGNGDKLSSYLMVWLREPPGQQPAGSAATAGATVTGLPGTWTIWKGMVNGLPIVNYVQPEGKDLSELEYDVLDVYNDAIKRNYSLPGAQILAVAVGYEVWNGPVSNIATEDFYVDVK